MTVKNVLMNRGNYTVTKKTYETGILNSQFRSFVTYFKNNEFFQLAKKYKR